MKAIICKQFGGPELLSLEEVPQPKAGPGQALVKIEAAGLNYADLVIIAGSYQEKPELPFVPGCEIAGIVVELGAGVTGLKIGDRVAGQMDSGGYAEYAAVNAGRLFPISDGLSAVVAAATFITYGTAYGSLRWRAVLREGETCLVLGGAGGVGLAAVVLAKTMGARVIGAASSPERCRMIAEHGADETIDYLAKPLRDEVRALTGKAGVDVVIDPVGGDLGISAFRSLGWSGRIVTLGFPSGKVQQYPANILLVKNIAALGMYFGSYIDRVPKIVREAFSIIHKGMAEGSIAKPPTTLASMVSIPNYLKKLAAREQLGKVVMSAETRP